MPQAADADDNAVIAVHDFEGIVLYTPPQRRLQQRQVMLLDDGFDKLEGVEGCVTEVTVAIDVALVGVGVGVAAFCGFSLELYLPLLYIFVS